MWPASCWGGGIRAWCCWAWPSWAGMSSCSLGSPSTEDPSATVSGRALKKLPHEGQSPEKMPQSPAQALTSQVPALASSSFWCFFFLWQSPGVDFRNESAREGFCSQSCSSIKLCLEMNVFICLISLLCQATDFNWLIDTEIIPCFEMCAHSLWGGWRVLFPKSLLSSPFLRLPVPNHIYQTTTGHFNTDLKHISSQVSNMNMNMWKNQALLVTSTGFLIQLFNMNLAGSSLQRCLISYPGEPWEITLRQGISTTPVPQ